MTAQTVSERHAETVVKRATGRENATRSELLSAEIVIVRATWLGNAQNRRIWPKSSVVTAMILGIQAANVRGQPIGLVSNALTAAKRAIHTRGARNWPSKLEVLEARILRMGEVNTTLLVTVEGIGMIEWQPMAESKLGMSTQHPL